MPGAYSEELRDKVMMAIDRRREEKSSSENSFHLLTQSQFSSRNLKSSPGSSTNASINQRIAAITTVGQRLIDLNNQ